MPERGGGINCEDHGRHFALAVERSDVFECGPGAVGLEVLTGRLNQIVGERVVPVIVDLDVHVSIDGREVGHIQVEFVTHDDYLAGSRTRSSGRGGKRSPTDCAEPARGPPNAAIRSVYDQPPSWYSVIAASGCV